MSVSRFRRSYPPINAPLYSQVLTDLSERLSVNTAYTHANIAPSAIVNVMITTDNGPTTIKALATPWYSAGDILEHIETCPTANKLILVHCIIVVSKFQS
jgi:hypothetical protein